MNFASVCPAKKEGLQGPGWETKLGEGGEGACCSAHVQLRKPGCGVGLLFSVKGEPREGFKQRSDMV